MAEFKKLSDVEVVAEPTESANVLIEENGVIKKAPKTAVGGSNTGGVTSWNDLEDKPFDVELAYFPGGDPINIGSEGWTSQDEWNWISRKLTTENNFADFPSVGDTFVIKTDAPYDNEVELVCCHIETDLYSEEGTFAILGDSVLAADNGFTDTYTKHVNAPYAVKCTLVRHEPSILEDPWDEADYGYIQVAAVTDDKSELPTVVEIVKKNIITIPDEFIPNYIPRVNTYAELGEVLCVQALDNNDRPSSWTTVRLPAKASAIDDVTEAPTAEQFNALLAALREAGYMEYPAIDEEY